jgi:hypothetical protein
MYQRILSNLFENKLKNLGTDDLRTYFFYAFQHQEVAAAQQQQRAKNYGKLCISKRTTTTKY